MSRCGKQSSVLGFGILVIRGHSVSFGREQSLPVQQEALRTKQSGLPHFLSNAFLPDLEKTKPILLIIKDGEALSSDTTFFSDVPMA